ncbi:MAG: TlyA family RNA methyltransferase [Clostridiales bacterium]|nr:TlyA family RNA methyltransferase [Clostridiales bacterium]
MTEKERLDIILVKRGFMQSRERARGAIMAGHVFVDGQKEQKCGAKFSMDCSIEVKEKQNPYVSRGGLKIHKGIEKFGIDLCDKICMDIGASTGGFTDCMLKHGASKVYAVDVGYGQLAWELRQDSRVVCMERTNIRYLEPEKLQELVDFVSVDVSFISLKKVLPNAINLSTKNASMLCLIKPQFEAGRDKVGKKGVVRDKDVHKEVIYDIVNFAVENHFNILGLDFSPIKGPEGNIEYLIYIQKNSENECDVSALVGKIVDCAHETLN